MKYLIGRIVAWALIVASGLAHGMGFWQGVMLVFGLSLLIEVIAGEKDRSR